MSRKEKPFDKILTVRSKLDMCARFGTEALGEQTVGEFLEEVRDAFEHLMTFRNIINGMVSFDEPPTVAVLPYLPADYES